MEMMWIAYEMIEDRSGESNKYTTLQNTTNNFKLYISNSP